MLQDVEECPICLEPIDPCDADAVIVTRCRHAFHAPCLVEYSRHQNETSCIDSRRKTARRGVRCPMCRRVVWVCTSAEDVAEEEEDIEDEGENENGGRLPVVLLTTSLFALIVRTILVSAALLTLFSMVAVFTVFMMSNHPAHPRLRRHRALNPAALDRD